MFCLGKHGGNWNIVMGTAARSTPADKESTTTPVRTRLQKKKLNASLNLNYARWCCINRHKTWSVDRRGAAVMMFNKSSKNKSTLCSQTKKPRQSPKPGLILELVCPVNKSCPWKNLRDKGGQRSKTRRLSGYFTMHKQVTMRQQQKALITCGELEIMTFSLTWMQSHFATKGTITLKENKLTGPEIEAVKESVNLTISKNQKQWE